MKAVFLASLVWPLASCGAAIEAPRTAGACLTNEIVDRIRFDMNSKLSSEDWPSGAGIALMSGRGRVCIEGHGNWPRETDTGFSVLINPPVYEVDMELLGIQPPPFYSVFDCGEEIPAGQVPRARDLEFELIQARVGYECRIRDVNN